MARKYPYAKSAQALYRPAQGSQFFDSWNFSDIQNDDLLCAEMCRLAYADRQTVSSVLSAIKFTLAHWVGGETREQRGATRGTDGFVATSDEGGRTVLAFRGTESNKPEDILTDALATSVPWKSGGQVHRGFSQAYALVQDDIAHALPASGRLLVTGHSLGAGLATLAAADFASRAVTLITFGSPLVGDSAFKQLLDGVDVHRFVDCCDLVTRIPPPRFDESSIEQLFGELIPPRSRPGPMMDGLIKTVAAGLAGALRALGVQPQYDHVRGAMYGDNTGTMTPGITASAIAVDQQTARHAYSGSLTPDVKHLMHDLVTAVLAAGAAGDASALRAAIGNFGARLFQGDPVPLRDLADHAPINYVSLLTGRQ